MKIYTRKNTENHYYIYSKGIIVGGIFLNNEQWRFNCSVIDSDGMYWDTVKGNGYKTLSEAKKEVRKALQSEIKIEYRRGYGYFWHNDEYHSLDKDGDGYFESIEKAKENIEHILKSSCKTVRNTLFKKEKIKAKSCRVDVKKNELLIDVGTGDYVFELPETNLNERIMADNITIKRFSDRIEVYINEKLHVSYYDKTSFLEFISLWGIL